MKTLTLLALLTPHIAETGQLDARRSEKRVLDLDFIVGVFLPRKQVLLSPQPAAAS